MTKKDSVLEETLHDLLCEKNFNSISKILKDPKNDAFILENVWNLINLICLTVKTNNLLKNETDVTSCKKILMFLVQRGNPKEVLISLLEQADSFKDHEFFCLLLDPLQYALQKTPGKRGKSLQWVLSTLNAHIETLRQPKNLDLQNEEKLLLDVDPAVQDTAYVLSNYFSFIVYFVDEVSFESLKKKEVHYYDRVIYQQELLQKYILKLFHHPLLYHDLHMLSDSRPKSTIRTLGEKYLKCLSKISKSVFNLFKHDLTRSCKESTSIISSEEDVVPSLAFANLSYLVFVEDMALDFQPLVYSHFFIFNKNLRYITLLLKMEHNLVLFKGLLLAENLLRGLNDFELNYDCLELETFTEFPKLLLNIAIHCKFETHRKSALSVFMSYMSKCNFKGRYHLIMQILSTVEHSGAKALAINSYKNYLHGILNNSSESGEYFLGKNFKLFVKNALVLREGVTTDILTDSDKIMSSLNFLRYILLRDPKENNLTGIWNLISAISEDFLTPLATAIDMSRAHYKQTLKDAETGKKDKESLNTTVTCNNEILPNVPVHFQKDLYRKALVTFDVIESVMSRVKEILSD